jgi:GABA permease
MSRVLVVANETVGAEELLAEIRRIQDRRTSRFHVLAPAVAEHHGVLDTWNQDGAISAAQERLDRTLAILRAEGLNAEGHVGDMVPLMAIEDALVSFPADTIVISTHPAERSRWLKKDLIEQARKRFERPVVHVVSHVHDNATA